MLLYNEEYDIKDAIKRMQDMKKHTLYQYQSSNNITRNSGTDDFAIDWVSTNNRTHFVKLMCPNCYNLRTHVISMISNITIKDAIDSYLDYDQKINDAGVYGYMVPKIYNTKCSKCKAEGKEQIILDYHIADTISILNKKGYRTKFCCEGHYEEQIKDFAEFEPNYFENYLSYRDATMYDYLKDEDDTEIFNGYSYIMFEEMNDIKNDIVLDIIKRTLPLTWRLLDKDSLYDNNIQIISIDKDNIQENLTDIYYWAESLPHYNTYMRERITSMLQSPRNIIFKPRYK